MPKPIAMSKPKPRENAIIDKGADTAPKNLQVSVYITQDTLNRVETARKSGAHLVLNRAQWLASAVIEKLARDGF